MPKLEILLEDARPEIDESESNLIPKTMILKYY